MFDNLQVYMYDAQGVKHLFKSFCFFTGKCHVILIQLYNNIECRQKNQYIGCIKIHYRK